MLRTCVLCCAAAGLLGLTVGCEVKTTPSSVTIKTQDDAVKAGEARLKELDASAEQLKAKLDKATGDEKVKLEAKWKESADKRAAAAKKLQELKAAAKDKWETVNKEAHQAFDDMKKAVE